jgi:hypothetical protein
MKIGIDNAVSDKEANRVEIELEDGSRFTIWDAKNGIHIVSLGFTVVKPCAKNYVKIESEE